MPKPLTRRTPPAPVGIVHLGLGAFFRAHGAIYIAEAMAAKGGNWGILGASLQTPRLHDDLAPQGFAYTALQAGPDGDIVQSIEIISDILVARNDPAALLQAMSDPAIKIVSLTVTEKGYCHNPADGSLNLSDPTIQHDLTNPLPQSAPGFLVRALQARHAGGHRPFTTLSCDNLPCNGTLTRNVVLSLAREIDPALADWIAAEARFPASMVDRIVPATKPEDLARVTKATGCQDASPVIHEPFRQWVVEDDFVDNQRPDLAAAGVQLVRDVAPFELMKLRMLNGTHSSLAYLGYLADYETISDTVADPVFTRYTRHLWTHEIIPTLTPPENTDLAAYAEQLLTRYQNPAIRHRTWQIAMDGSQKLPQRILNTLAHGHKPGLTLAVAAWIKYVSGTDLNGQAIDVRDPLAADLRAAHTTPDPVATILADRRIFSAEIATRIRPQVTQAYQTLSKGARAAILEMLND